MNCELLYLLFFSKYTFLVIKPIDDFLCYIPKLINVEMFCSVPDGCGLALQENPDNVRLSVTCKLDRVD